MNEKLKLLAGLELLPSSWPPWVHLNCLGHTVPHFIGDDGDGDSMMVIETMFWSIRKSRYHSFTPGKVMVAMCNCVATIG